MNLLGEKIIGIFIVLIVPLITGLLVPFIFHRRRFRPSLAPLSSTSTGILLGVFLLHVLPRSTDRLRHALDGSKYQSYPVGELLVGLGFFLVIAFELVIITYHNRDKIMSRADSFDEIGSEEHDEIIQSLSGSYQSNGAPMFFEHSINTEQTPLLRRAADTTSLDDMLSSGKVYVLLFGLSIHSFFEGLVIGFEEEHRGMWALIVSVVLHKSLISFSLGLSAFNVFLYIRNVIYVILIFVTSAPVGALLGALLKELLSHQQKTDIVIDSLNCMAAGTFVFIVFMELIPDNLKIESPFRNVAFVFAGFTSIAIMQLFI